MLKVGLAMGHGREVRGQLWRPALTPIGHLPERLTIGNTGGASVNAFVPMPIPDERRDVLDPERERPSAR